MSSRITFPKLDERSSSILPQIREYSKKNNAQSSLYRYKSPNEVKQKRDDMIRKGLIAPVYSDMKLSQPSRYRSQMAIQKKKRQASNNNSMISMEELL